MFLAYLLSTIIIYTYSPVPGHPEMSISFGASLPFCKGGELKVRRCLIDAFTDVSYLWMILQEDDLCMWMI